MSFPFRTNLDLGTNQLLNGVVQNLSSDPGTGKVGQIYYNTGSSVLKVCTNATGPVWTALSSGSGSVTTVSVVSANGFAGTVANATTTPAITLTTSVTGLLKGNGTAVSAATSGTDYAPATSGSAILKGNGSGGFSNAVASTDYIGPTSGSAIQKASSGGLAAAVANTDYLPVNNPAITGNGTATTQASSDNSTNIATTAFVQSVVAATAQGLQIKPTARAATAAALPANTYANGTAGVGATLTGNSNGALASVDGLSLGAAVAQTITNVTFATTTITATVSSTVGMAVGQAVSVTGITGFTTNNPNGDYVINTVPSGTTFTYIVGSAPTGSYSSGGSAVTLADIVLVKNEATSANNGLYTVTTQGTASTAYVLTRHVAMDITSEFDGAFIAVGSGGTANANSLWLCNPVDGSIVVGTTNVTFTQLNGATDLIPGTGINISGNTVSLVTPVAAANGGAGTVSGILKANGSGTVSAAVSATDYAPATSGSSILKASSGGFANAVSGTDYAPATSGSSILKGNGSGGFSAGIYQANNGATTTTTWSITHSLGNSTPIVQVYDVTAGASAGVMVICDVTITSSNALTLTFATAMVANQYNVTVIG